MQESNVESGLFKTCQRLVENQSENSNGDNACLVEIWAEYVSDQQIVCVRWVCSSYHQVNQAHGTNHYG